MTEWKPWDQFKQEPEVLPIHAPPCPNCEFWKPQRKYAQYGGSVHFDGIVLCQREDDICHDFSCFRKKEPK